MYRFILEESLCLAALVEIGRITETIINSSSSNTAANIPTGAFTGTIYFYRLRISKDVSLAEETQRPIYKQNKRQDACMVSRKRVHHPPEPKEETVIFCLVKRFWAHGNTHIIAVLGFPQDRLQAWTAGLYGSCGASRRLPLGSPVLGKTNCVCIACR